MEGIDQFEQSFIVGQYECDCNGRMKAGALLSQTQAISTNHCNAIGWTIDVPTRFFCWQRPLWRYTARFAWEIISAW